MPEWLDRLDELYTSVFAQTAIAPSERAAWAKLGPAALSRGN